MQKKKKRFTYQCQTANHNHGQDEPLKVLVLHKSAHMKTHLMPRTSQTRISVMVAADAWTVTEGWAAILYISFVLDSHNSVTPCQIVFRGTSGWNAWVNIPEAQILAWAVWASRHARVAVRDNWTRTVDSKVAVAQVVVATNQTSFAFYTVDMRHFGIHIRHVSDSVGCFVQINGSC